LIREATLLVDKIGADLWIVQGSTRGPFAEISRVPANLEDRARAVPGVASARRFVSHTIQREHRGRPLRMVVQGLAWPEDRGNWVPLVAGRPLRQAHYEMIADRSLGLPLGERITLGKNVYEVVGLTKGMVGTGGDGLTFFTISDAMMIQFDVPGEATRLERAARQGRLVANDLGRVQPLLIERTGGLASEIPALSPPQVSAVMITLQPGADALKVAATFSNWPDVTVYSKQQQIDLLLSGMVDKARRQLGLFRVLLIIISTIIMALIIYTLTLDKIHDIALLKLIGARNGVIVGLILQQALLIGGLGYGLAYWLGTFAFPQFPRLVVIETPDLLMLAGVVLGISVLSSLLGIWKAMGVEPNKVLS
jgi:putative ABC transport system permease protein